MARHNEIGSIGEKIAADFLKRKGLEIVETNYRRSYGEIDIVARELDPKTGKKNLTRFIEVKTVSYETGGERDPAVQGGVTAGRVYRPEENVDDRKVSKLSKVISAYIISNEIGRWEFDVIAVFVDTKNKKAKVKWLKNLLLEE